jgi:Holliday junction resolvasome RuvABC endonuclease subunit
MSEKRFGPGLPQQTSISIGIDQSLTGFALTFLAVDNPSQFVTYVYKSPYNGVQRLKDISQWIMEKLESFRDHYIVDVAMEGTVLASQSALVLGELSATVKLVLWDYFGDYDKQPHLQTPLQIPPMTLKKYAAGKGNAKKQEMLLQIYKRWGIEFNDDNAADSYALARLAGKISEGVVEDAVAEQIKDPKYRDQIH